MLSNLRRGPLTPLTIALPLLLMAQPSVCALADTEKIFIEVPSPDSARESLRYITSKPHVAGTPGDYEVREVVTTAASFRHGSWGGCFGGNYKIVLALTRGDFFLCTNRLAESARA